MPTEPRIPAEPTLEELSAYLDRELDAATQARLADHVAGCAECTLRLDALRETVNAVRALPMETPTRSFTVPAQRRQSLRWAPVGWLGGAAAAMLVVVLGVTQFHPQGPAGTASTSTAGGGLAQSAPYKEVAPAAGQAQALDSNAYAARAATNRTVIIDPRNASRSLTVGTDANSYSTTGVISLHVSTSGLTVDEAKSVRLLLVKDTGGGGYGVRLGPPSKASTFPLSYDAAYSIQQMPLPAPVAGSYMLQVTIDTSDGYALVARLPLTITP